MPPAALPGVACGGPASLRSIQTGNRDIFIHICEKSVLTKRDEFSQKRTHALLYQIALGGQASMVEDVLSWAHDWSQASLERALDNAVSGWHVEAVRIRLSRFSFSKLCLARSLSLAADFRSDLISHPREECTGLDYLNQQQLIHCLVNVGADPNAMNSGANLVVETSAWADKVGALKALLEEGVDPDGRDSKGATALHHLGSPVLVKKSPRRCFREAGIRVLLQVVRPSRYRTISVKRPCTTPHLAPTCTSSPSTPQVCQRIVDATTNCNFFKNNSGETLLHWVAAGKKTDILRFLSSSGAKVNATNDNGWTPLMCALIPSTATKKFPLSQHEILQAARILLDHEVDPLTSTHEGWTPLHCLSLYLDDGDNSDDGVARLAEEFVAEGVSVNSRATMLAIHTPSCLSPLNLEVGVWGSRVEACLCSNDSTRPLEVIKDSTPLHWAIFHGAVGVAIILLAKGADVDALDENNERPADLIDSSLLSQRHPEIRAKLARSLTAVAQRIAGRSESP